MINNFNILINEILLHISHILYKYNYNKKKLTLGIDIGNLLKCLKCMSHFDTMTWLVDDEDENNPTKEQIKKADLILGHFEFINFEFLPGIVSSHGFSTDNYKNKKVLSGHYHIMSEQNKIKYLDSI